MLPALVVTPHSSPYLPFGVLYAMLGEDAYDDGKRKAVSSHLFKETDPYTDLLFFVPEAHFLDAWVSRFVVDLNRYRDDLGANGVIKETDFKKRPLYPPDFSLDEARQEERLKRYWGSFHAQLERLLSENPIRLLVDGHSMSATGPALGPDQGRPRPALCLMTGGDAAGEPVPGQRTSVSPEQARALQKSLEKHFLSLIEETPEVKQTVALNTPWDVDELADMYGAPERSVRVPGFGLEINQGLYLQENGEPMPGRIQQLNGAFRRFLKESLELFYYASNE